MRFGRAYSKVGMPTRQLQLARHPGRFAVVRMIFEMIRTSSGRVRLDRASVVHGVHQWIIQRS